MAPVYPRTPALASLLRPAACILPPAGGPYLRQRALPIQEVFMLIRDMLKLKGPKVETVAPDASLREAVRIACERHIGSLLVLDGGRLVGIITERDILRQVHARADFDTTPVGAVMSRDVV